ncbi:MAG: GNAT family N-acetyltransferase [Chloroflexi bacterium]|jgi:ribosomal protein S18 acetylase RimI-like enzyme|nr:GNAT family N-acetyltransferase [Anaerolineaceae bacterium]NLI45264.1 GNAT family N-acetyltransferase [Chloroflexota bacterium]HOA22104.1 GNAT family N-acetyltransferase [Anaerolineaceae bacterium]HOE35530.1 GNAT family N-acetyltransferase [Anaerolineaceae bacterium]HOT26406.1 GNAT family N-acetyltransferase [Anaerolineaceae bacterium]
MHIRQLTPDDYPRIFALWQQTPGMGLNNLDDSPEGISRYLRRNPSTCFAAEENDQLVGVILSGHDGRRGFIYHLAVAAPYQRRGIGSALVQAALEALREEGIHKAALVVMARNQTGNAFWEKVGFTTRPDLVYRDKLLDEMIRYDT